MYDGCYELGQNFSLYCLAFTLFVVRVRNNYMGTTEVLEIQTILSGEIARLRNGTVCITPCSIALSCKENFDL